MRALVQVFQSQYSRGLNRAHRVIFMLEKVALLIKAREN